MLQEKCPDGTSCPPNHRCCKVIPPIHYGCCLFAGLGAQCCPDHKTCCPPGFLCGGHKTCLAMRGSSALQVQAILLVNSTDQRSRDGTIVMDAKVSNVIPSQQEETASKRNGFTGTSGDVFSPDQKYQCSDGTSICELSSGVYGCCHLVRGYVNFWQESLCFLASRADTLRARHVFHGRLVFSWLRKNAFSLPVTESIIFIIMFPKKTT